MATAVSAAERDYIMAGIAADLREDGRGRGEYRRFELETGLAANTNGSARLRVGPTDVLVGVKMEVAAPEPDAPNMGRVEVGTQAGRHRLAHVFHTSPAHYQTFRTHRAPRPPTPAQQHP